MSESVAIPTDLRRPHRFVVTTRDAAAGVRAREDGRIELGRAPKKLSRRDSTGRPPARRKPDANCGKIVP